MWNASVCAVLVNIISTFVILSLYLSNLPVMKPGGVQIFFTDSGDPQSKHNAALAESKKSFPMRSMQRCVADQFIWVPRGLDGLLKCFDGCERQ